MNAQQLIIGHLLPIAAAIAVLWLAYRLLFINSNRLRFNRLFLLSAMLFSLVLPLLGLWVGTEAPQMVSLKQNLLGGTMLGEIVVTPDGQTALPEAEIVANATVRPQISVWQVLAVIYLIGVGVAALLLLIKLGKLAALVIRSPKEKREGYTAVFTGREQGSFSFFRYAFFPNENVAPDIERHEASHIGHRHSWDILFVEVMMVLQWFNPFIYLYKKELQSLHEYQADRDVVATGVDKRNYMMLILQQCTAVDFSGIGNNFSLILTKKRIKMITKNEKAKGLWWRLLATLPVLAILLIANTKVTAQEAAVNEQKDEEQATTVIRPENNGETTVYNISTTKDLKAKVTLKDADSIKAKVTLKDADSIFQIVDQMPEFPGGIEALMDFVGKNVKYPEQAKEKEISGRVFIGFVIEKDGSVSNVKVLRGIGGGCDEEAVRVIKAMPKWTPGKLKGQPVRVSYQIPINFKLDNPQKDNLKHLEGTLYKGIGTGKKGDVTNTMAMQMVFDTEDSGYFIMTLSSQKKNGKKNTEFEDVFLQFQYAFDGKSIGSIQPKNMDGGELGDEPMPPYGFLINKDGSITVSFYDFKNDIGIEQIVFKKVVK